MRKPLEINHASLTLDEINRVRESCRTLERSGPFVADAFFQHLFEYAPWLRVSFSSDPWRARLTFLAMLRGTSLGLTRPAHFDSTVRELVKLYRTQGVGNDVHYYIGAAWFAVLAQALGRGFTQDLYAAWFKIFERIVSEVRRTAVQTAIEPGTTKLLPSSTAQLHVSAA